jgi:hypothetical protein
MSNPFSNFKSAISWPDDGLDEDGYPLEQEKSWRFTHGCEKDAGDWQPISLYDATMALLDRRAQTIDIGDSCESPIEAQIGAALLMFFERAGRPLKLALTFITDSAPDELLLVPQYGWHYYRSDWAIVNPKSMGALLIECDGRDFHSSPLQKAHDAKKDAAALNRGYLTLRFTGSQIYQDADACAQKIYDAVYGS